jgi:hypothetical protein
MTDMPTESADELNQRLREIDEKAEKLKREIIPLTQEREGALATGNVQTSVPLKHKIDEYQERLNDLHFSRDVAKGKLRVYDQNAPEATKVRDKANAFWEEGRALIDEFVKMQSRARMLYGKALEIDQKIDGLGNEHLRLVGRDMRGPSSITNTVYQLGAFAAPNVQAVKPLERWQYVSDEELAAKHKEEVDRKLKQHEARIKIVEDCAPDCPACARGNKQTRMIVDRRSGRSDTRGESLYHGHWHLVCPKCGATLTQSIPETKK